MRTTNHGQLEQTLSNATLVGHYSVGEQDAPLKEDKSIDLGWYDKAPELKHPEYKRFYVRDVEWFTIGDNLEGIELIKRRIMTEGAIGTCYAANGKSLSKENIHYQAISAKGDPNHSVAIVGWDDTKISAVCVISVNSPGSATAASSS